MTGLYEQDLSSSSLNTARSALSSIITIDSIAVGSHPAVARFRKGVYNLRPPMPRYRQIWDVSVVLQYLKTWHPLSSLTLKDLTQTCDVDVNNYCPKIANIAYVKHWTNEDTELSSGVLF